MIMEEYNPKLLDQYENIFMLTQTRQSDDLSPYQKSRSIFFIFIEEVLLRIMDNNKEKDE